MRRARALDLTVDALAAYRLARFVVAEDAPPAQRARELADQYVPARWAAAIDCQHCTGLWAALALGALRAIPGGRLLAWPLAAAGVQSILASFVEVLEETEVEPQGVVMDRGASPSTADDRPRGWASGERQGFVSMTERP